MKFRFRILLVVFMISASLIALAPPAERYFEIAKNLDIFATLFKEVNALYVDEVNPNTLVKTGIDAMLESLDPYTNYIPEDLVEDFRTINTGQYGGIGAVTREIGNRTWITQVMSGYPAERGGLKVGDEVIKIDQVELSKVSPEAAGQLMKGEVGKPVSLTVKRMGTEKPIELEFKREKIKINNVPYAGMVSESVGYIQLSEFTPEAGKNVKSAFLKLREQNIKGLILDMRGNPGGLLMEAVNICNIFIPRGKKVVSTKGKILEQNMTYETLDSPVDTEIPVVVLINRGSASASEIVAGTLQDYDRGVILGEKSYGKGLVQVSRPLSYNAQLKVTTAKYYTPTGRCIQVLDYSHRREDGSVGAIPDSVKSPFKTQHGRTVYDGGGIDPDIAVEQTMAHPITQVLFDQGLIFEYATRYAFEHATIPSSKNFSLTDEEYIAFTQWMKGRSYTYTSSLDAQLHQLQEEARRERYFQELKPQLDAIQNRLEENRKNELILYKDEIKMLLEQEIAIRYYNEQGSIEVGFRYDQDMKKAIELLGNPTRYKQILHLP